MKLSLSRAALSSIRAALDYLLTDDVDDEGHHADPMAHRLARIAAKEGLEVLDRHRSPPRKSLKLIAGKSLAEKREEKRETHRAATALVREAVWKRSVGYCECGCARRLAEYEGELDHFRGGSSRRLLTNTANCWRLAAYCHREKTRNIPDGAHWRMMFAVHLERCGLPVPSWLADTSPLPRSVARRDGT